MRVLVTTTSYPSVGAPFNGVFIRSHAEALAARGHEVRILVPHVFAEDSAEESDGGLSVRRIPYGSDGRLLSDRAGLPLAMTGRLLLEWNRVAREDARRWRPDIVHAHWAIPSGVPARAAARTALAPLVVTVHGADLRLASRHRMSAGLLMRWVLRGAGGVVAVSAAMSEQLQNDYGVPSQRIAEVPMGVDAQLFSPASRSASRVRAGLPADVRVVLAVGALIPIKRFSDVVGAWLGVLGKHPSAMLVVAGSGSERDVLERRAQQAGIAHSVRFMGAVPHEDLPVLFNAADAVVLPSETEGLPVALMEAAACGVPCIATPVGGSPQVIALHPGSRLVPVGDQRALRDAIVEVLSLDQPDVRPSVLEPGSPFTLEGSVGRVEAVYASLRQQRA